MKPLLMSALLLVAAPVLADDPQRPQLDGGKVLLDFEDVPGSSVPRVKLRAVIDAPPERVWPLIANCAGYKGLMPRIVESEELSRDGNRVRCRTLLDAPWPAKDLESYVNAELIVGNGSFVRRWEFEKGDFKHNRGTWTLTAFEGNAARTLVVYETHAEPKNSVPGFLRDFAQKRGLPGIIDNLREAVKAPAK